MCISGTQYMRLMMTVVTASIADLLESVERV